jgi:hypothetical protein
VHQRRDAKFDGGVHRHHARGMDGDVYANLLPFTMAAASASSCLASGLKELTFTFPVK